MKSLAPLVIDADSFAPLTEQVRRGISDQILSGALSPGDRLPSVRQLARDLNIAPGTVAKAYQALETAGLVRTRGRNGTVIADGRRPRNSRTDAALRRAARRYLVEAQRLGSSPSEAMNVAKEIASELASPTRSPVRPTGQGALDPG